jgi:outer membrane protein
MKIPAAVLSVTLPLLSLSCAPYLPPPAKAPITAPAPDTFWKAPKSEVPPVQPPAIPEIPKDLAERAQSMTLLDVLDLALRNSPLTKLAWAQARAAAANYESKKGAYYPTITADAELLREQTAPSQSTPAARESIYGGAVSLSSLLLDFGGRWGSTENARQALLASDWTHNAVIQNVVLNVELAYHQYMAAKALLEAQKASFKEAETNLESANVRHDAGVATIADVLQAKTALSQQQLALDSLQGALQTTRGALAVSMGLPANIPFDIEEAPREVPLDSTLEAVDRLIQQALDNRPDLWAARAEAEAAVAHVTEVKSDGLPSLSFDASGGRGYIVGSSLHADTYTAGIFLHIPIFTGFSQTNKVREAEAQAMAANENQKSLETQVIYQVFSLKTATQRAKTANDLIASASTSEQVALERYRAGVGNILDLLAAQSALADARAQHIKARWDWHSALAQLTHDTGILGLHGESPIIPTTGPSSSEKESQ